MVEHRAAGLRGSPSRLAAVDELLLRAAAIACCQSAGSLPSLRRSNSSRSSAGAALTRSAQACARRAPLAPISRHASSSVVGNDEGRRVPAQDLARAGDLFLARRVAMRLLGAGLGREAEADDGLAGDHRRLVGHRAAVGDGVADRVGVVAVDLLDVPAGGAEALDLVVGYREASVAPSMVMRVVVPERDQLAELADGRPARSLPG